MDITYLGAGAVRMVGRDISVVSDPYTEIYGLGKLNARADVITISGPDDSFGLIPGAMKISMPGEYEVKGTMITGVATRLHTDDKGKRATVYGLRIDGINIVIAGMIGGRLDERDVETLGKVDVLIVPVGGHGLTLETEEAASVVAQLEPSYVIPVHFDDDRTIYPVPQSSVDGFLKEMGSHPEPQSKLKVSTKDLPEETQVILLQRV